VQLGQEADEVLKAAADDNGYLEYATPFEFLYETKTIVEALKPFAGWDRARPPVPAPTTWRPSTGFSPSGRRNCSTNWPDRSNSAVRISSGRSSIDRSPFHR
jgi:hypothetical protein